MNGVPELTGRDSRLKAQVAILVTALVLLATYMLLHFGGRWGETDAGSNSRAIQAMLDAGRLIYNKGLMYPNGYGYQALSVFLIQVTGITTSQLQLYWQLFLMPWIVFPAWLLYRELTGSGRGATLSTAILLVQPEFLFPLVRGTHEKFTRGLILLALYLFVKSLSHSHRPSRILSYLLSFYLVVYGFIAFNNLLAFSLITALLLALQLLAVVRWWTHSRNPSGANAEKRLRYALPMAGILTFLFTFYFYPPARSNILVMENMLDRTASLFLDVEFNPGTNPYAYTGTAWVSGPVYIALSIANWITLLVSAAFWLWQTWPLLRHRSSGLQQSQLLLWALYGGFAIQEALSIIVDLSGSLAANLQVRAFPAFVMLAAPLISRTLVDWQESEYRIRRIIWSVMTVVLAILAALSVLKATNEPLFSNKWAFYIPAEMQALDRAELILPDRLVWMEFDERLFAACILRDPKVVFPKKYFFRDVLVSDVIRTRAVRNSSALPIEADSLITYDNGQAQLYHLRPRTPYQP